MSETVLFLTIRHGDICARTASAVSALSKDWHEHVATWVASFKRPAEFARNHVAYSWFFRAKDCWQDKMAVHARRTAEDAPNMTVVYSSSGQPPDSIAPLSPAGWAHGLHFATLACGRVVAAHCHWGHEYSYARIRRFELVGDGPSANGLTLLACNSRIVVEIDFVFRAPRCASQCVHDILECDVCREGLMAAAVPEALVASVRSAKSDSAEYHAFSCMTLHITRRSRERWGLSHDDVCTLLRMMAPAASVRELLMRKM